MDRYTAIGAQVLAATGGLGITVHLIGVNDVLHYTIRMLEALLRLLRQAGESCPADPLAALHLMPSRSTAVTHEQPAPTDPERTDCPLWLAMYGTDLRRRPSRGTEGVA